MSRAFLKLNVHLLLFFDGSTTQWEVLTIFASAMGPAEVAAWGMLGLIWDTFERITAGFADAAEVRIGFRMGAGQPQSAKIAAFKSMYMALVVSLFSTTVLYIFAGNLPRWMTPDPTLQKMVSVSLVSPVKVSSVVNAVQNTQPQIFEVLPLVRKLCFCCRNIYPCDLYPPVACSL